jgi:cytosine/adenosine deaminase-related metal-dependent hydrolase
VRLEPLRTDAINVLPLNNAYGAVVLAMDTSNVDTVFVAGRVRKRGGRLLNVDLDRVSRLAAASRAYILERTGWPSTFLGGHLPGR